VRRGDFDDADNLAHAFERASQVLVVSANALGGTAVRLNRRAIAAAKAAGAQPVLYTSHLGSSPNSAFPPMHTHAASEAALQELGMPFTSLRNGFYASSAVMQLSRALGTGEPAVPEEGPIAWTAHAGLLPGPIGTTVTHWLASNAGESFIRASTRPARSAPGPV